jgi:hypothetical protein
MTDRPISFKAPMIRALLDGTKTQTRRLIKPQPADDYTKFAGFIGGREELRAVFASYEYQSTPVKSKVLFGVGNRLWVKEAWSGTHVFKDTPPSQRESFATPDGPCLRDELWYWADGDPQNGDWEKPRPSIHMTRWASRLTLIVTDVRVQRLQDISEADAIAEGVESTEHWRPKDVEGKPFGDKWWDDATFWAHYPQLAYASLWNHINGAGAWEANPWVVAYSFSVHVCNIDQMEGADG